MSKKTDLKQILQKFTGTDDKTLEAFQTFNSAVSKLQSDLKQKIQVATVDKVNGELDTFQKKIDYQPILDALTTLKTNFKSEISNITTQLEQTVAQMITISENKEEAQEKHDDMNDDISMCRGQIKDAIAENNKKLDILRKECTDADNIADKKTDDKINTVDKKISEIQTQVTTNDEENDVDIKTLTDAIPALKQELLTRIGQIGGGSMNRKISFNNVDYLTRYTDINYKGTNITYVISNNDQTKQVDINIVASASGGGTVRSINSVSIPTTAGASAGTDYVYLVSGTTTITMPTAVNNKNLYTIKNVGSGIVTVVFNGAETGDGQTTLTMPVQFTSIDLISDTVNFNIT